MDAEKRVILEEEELRRTISRMAHEIVEKNGGAAGLALVGIRSRGAHLARRIGRKIEALTAGSPATGVVDITPYRDDIDHPQADVPPRMEVPVTIDGRTVVIVDD